MKKFIILLLSVVAFSKAYTQVVIQLGQNSVLSAGVNNPLTMAIPDSKSGSVTVTTDNGKITGTYPNYSITPEKTGKAELTIKWKSNKGEKKSNSKHFSVNEPQTQFATFGGKQGGDITEAIAHEQKGLFTDPLAGSNEPTQVNELTMIVIRDGKVVFLKNLYDPNGIRFTDDQTTTNWIKSLKINDKLLFINVSVTGADNKPKHLLPLEFTIS